MGWGGLGVTGSDARMHEKGPGKWAEVDADAAGARARARLTELGDAAPAREVDLSGPAPSGGRWVIPVLVVALLVAGLAVWLTSG
jgi:hypothetical protein